MTADAWTIIATQLVTTLGIIYFLVQRMDVLGRDLRTGLGARIDRVESQLGARIEAVRDDLGARIDAQTARIDAHIERHPS